MEHNSNYLKYKRLGISTHNESVAYMHKDCLVCKSEGFEALTRIRIINNGKSIVVRRHVCQS